MRIVRESSRAAVLSHWEHVDRSKTCPHVTLWRQRIWGPLPTNIQWCEARIEEHDLERLFIISSDDWRQFSPSLKLSDVTRAISNHADSTIAQTIRDFTEQLSHRSDTLDNKLIIVSPSLNGDFTVIDGNKRSIALYNLDRLVGSPVYLGTSPLITNYPWAKRPC